MSDVVKINDVVFGGDVCDGETTNGAVINNSFTIAAGGYKTFNLYDMLPEDQYDYLCYFESMVTTGTTSGNTAQMLIYNGNLNEDNISTKGNWYTSLGRVLTRASNFTRNRLTACIPVSNDRVVTVRNPDGSGTSGACGLWLKSYKRISTNGKRKYRTTTINNDTIKGDFIPGSWVSKSVTALSNQTIASSGNKSYSLSSYLPNDGNTYEIYGYVICHTGATSGNSAVIRVGTANNSSGRIVCSNVARASGDMLCSGTLSILAKSTDTLYMRNEGNATTGSTSLYLRGYRKINTQRSITGIDTISIPTKNDFVNVVEWGSPTVNGSVISNFSSNNFCEIPLDKTSFTNTEPFTMQFKFKTGTITTDSSSDDYTQYIVNAFNFFEISIAGNKLYTYNYAQSSSTMLDFDITANTDYIYNIALGYVTTSTSSYYQINASLTNLNTGVTIKHTPVDDTLVINSSVPIIIGTHSLSAYKVRKFTGSVDLSQSYIKKNNEIIWQGMDKKRYVSIGGHLTDGAFIYKSRAVFTGTAFTKGSSVPYTISDYLPDDSNYYYEVYWRAYGRTVSTSAHACTLTIDSITNSVISNQQISYCRTRTASSHIDSLSGKFVTKGTSFTIKVKQTNTTYDTGNCGLYLIGYRRVV